jgi:hypothetical protein
MFKMSGVLACALRVGRVGTSIHCTICIICAFCWFSLVIKIKTVVPTGYLQNKRLACSLYANDLDGSLLHQRTNPQTHNHNFCINSFTSFTAASLLLDTLFCCTKMSSITLQMTVFSFHGGVMSIHG